MLTPYIKDLLYRYDKVIIPNFGGLISNKISAQIDEENHTFYPPKKELTFNTDLKENDGLLADYIVSKDHITKEAAQNFINFQVDDWYKRLDKEPIILDGIGIFTKDTYGKVQFLADESSNFLADSFGLSQVKTTSVKRATTSVISNEKVKKEPLKTGDNQHKNRKLGWLRYAAFIALFIALATVIYELYVNDYFTKEKYRDEQQNKAIELEKPNRTLNLNSENTDNNTGSSNSSDTLKVDKNTTANTSETPTETETANSKIENANTKQEDIDQSVPTTEYFIIVGAFGDATNAQKQLNQLTTDGFQNALTVDSPHSKLTHVGCGPYSSLKDCQVDLRKIRQKNPGAWVLKKKTKN